MLACILGSADIQHKHTVPLRVGRDVAKEPDGVNFRNEIVASVAKTPSKEAQNPDSSGGEFWVCDQRTINETVGKRVRASTNLLECVST